MLRRSGKPLALLVNKIDQPTHHADRVNEFYALGIDQTYAVSAEHGGGAFDALETIVLDTLRDEDEEQGEAPGRGRRRCASRSSGRPNVGKSSIANRLAGEERVVVSNAPGTTRDAVDIRDPRDDGGQDYVLVDTAGIGKRRQATGVRASTAGRS